MKREKKFNNGRGAILCNRCRVIVMEGFYPEGTITKEEWESDEPVMCKKCQNRFKKAEDILSKVKLGMNRKEVVAALGEPTDESITTKKRKFPGIFKYDDIELHFTDGWDGTLWLVYSENGRGGDPVTHAKC